MSRKPKSPDDRVSWRDLLPIHPAAELFPLMSPDELRALADDIKQHGLRHPAIFIEDENRVFAVLDGRNRLDALELLGEEITLTNSSIFEERPSDIDPYAYVISANIHRRHLTAEQKRDLIAKVLKATPEKSDRQLGKQLKTDHKTIAKVRREKESTGEVSPVEKRIGADRKARKPPTKRRRTEDDFRRDLQAKKAATIATDAPADSVAANPITAAWDKASDERRQEFLQARHLQRKRGRPPTGSKKPPQPKRKGGWPKGKPRKRQEAAE